MRKDLGSLPPRVAAAMAEREEERMEAACKACCRQRGLELEDCIRAATKGVFTILGNGGIAKLFIPGRSGNA